MSIKHSLLIALAFSLGGCDTGGNLRSTSDYDAPPAFPINHSEYNPYAAYGEARADWSPPVKDRAGAIVRPYEPASQANGPADKNGGQVETKSTLLEGTF